MEDNERSLECEIAIARLSTYRDIIKALDSLSVDPSVAVKELDKLLDDLKKI